MIPSTFGNMKKVFCCLVAGMICLSEVAQVSAVLSMNNTEKYPACIEDNDCRRLDNHVCFQYFCYPWQTVSSVAATDPLILDLCRSNKDCPKKGGQKQECFRHHDKRKITSGICIPSTDTCSEHEDCEGKGGKCCNTYCCNEPYYDAIMDLPCVSNEGCQVKKCSSNSFSDLDLGQIKLFSCKSSFIVV